MSDNLATQVESKDTAATVGDWPVVPGYELLAELGRGGMGVVFKARQLATNRLVALKLIRDSALAGARERGRFRIEAEAVARLQHPNVVSIYEIGEHQGRPFYSMELIEGPSLSQYIARQPQPPRIAAKLVRSLALAVAHAHEHKIVHRDLKPANILLLTPDSCLLTADTCQLTPKIADFGLAKRLDTDSTAWTQDGSILGTANYMAPEQAAGRVSDIGPGVDIYALGAILYEMLTGRPPFHADSWNLILNQVLNQEPRRPSQLCANIPRDLESVCLKCLEKEPAERYLRAEDLASDLGRFLEGQAVVAKPIGAAERIMRLAGREGFQIIGEIGRGPRSIVYEASFGQLKQPVALKIFAPGLVTRDEWEARLKQGADQWSVLTHPQIVLVQQFGWLDDAPYLATELVPHGCIASQPPKRRDALGHALRLVESLIEVVCYMHRQGAVHGNLKPSNVLLAADSIPRVIDMRATSGLALQSQIADDADPLGVGYVAPELLRAPDRELRPYTDVYGLGLILYELIAGRPAFSGKTAGEVLQQVREVDPVPPSQFNANVTPALDALCLRCLRKNPWRRFIRAFDLLARVRQLRDDPEDRAMSSRMRNTLRPPRPEGS